VKSYRQVVFSLCTVPVGTLLQCIGIFLVSLAAGLAVNKFLFKNNAIFVLNLHVMSRNKNKVKCTDFFRIQDISCMRRKVLKMTSAVTSSTVFRPLDRTKALC